MRIANNTHPLYLNFQSHVENFNKAKSHIMNRILIALSFLLFASIAISQVTIEA